MQAAEMDERLRLFEQEVSLAGEAVATLKRDQRAEIDALRLEIAMLRHCLFLLHPTLKEQWESIRAEVVQRIDPEASTL